MRLATLPLLVALSTPLAAQTLVTDSELRLRADPSTAAEVVALLPAGTPLRLVSDSGRGEFFRVEVKGDPSKVGWVSGRYVVGRFEPPPRGAMALGASPSPPARSDALMEALAPAYPACGGEHHYRWAAKVSPSSEDGTPHTASVTTMLHRAQLPFRQDLASWCAPRATREDGVFRVTGWVRRTKPEADGDVHIEITASAGAPVGSCLVVEIPPASYGDAFGTARADLASALGVASLAQQHDLADPVRVRFIGRAFFDGWHATDGLPQNHGRCNSTSGSAWELHPVYAVEVP